MAIKKCNEQGATCFCRVELHSLPSPEDEGREFAEKIGSDTLPEQNVIFKSLRDQLSGPPDGATFPFPFFFHMLDGFRPETVSLGHDLLSPELARNFEEKIRLAATDLNQRGGSAEEMGIVDVLSHVCEQTADCDSLIRGARAFVATRGQPITKTPSRLEQVFTIRTSPNHSSQELPYIRHKSGVYYVENYLGICNALEDAYQKSIARVMPDTKGPIAKLHTVPYLAAEHLLLANAYSSGALASGVRELETQKPGIAILPFAVLGQFRAAGVWFYKGDFFSAENERLLRHLEHVGLNATNWLSTTVSQMVVHSSSTMLFRALGGLAEAGDMRLIQCRLVQRALSSLWFSTSVSVEVGDALVPVHVNEGAERVARRGINCQRFPLSFSSDPEVVKLLGFEKAHFDIPFYEHTYNRDIGLIEPLFNRVTAGILAEHQRARKHVRANFRKKLDVTAHDYANAINNLMVFADEQSDRGQGLSSDIRLRIVRQVASHMRGYAWILRAIAKSESEADEDGAGFSAGSLSDIEFSGGEPTAEDLATWRNYLYWETLYTAFAALEKFALDTKDRQAGLQLKYRFECIASLPTGEEMAPWERDKAVGETALLEALNDRQDRQRPHWPLRAAKGGATKLNDLGRVSIILWGALELLRNACETTAYLINSQPSRLQTLYVGVKFERTELSWKLQIRFDNPLLSSLQEPPAMEAFPWYAPMRQLMPYIQYRKVPTRDRAVYEFEMEIPHANS